MRKRLITPTPETVRSRGEGWLEIERVAIVEITSEEKDYPVEAAFVSGETPGWRAAEPGPQTIRLVFDQPQRLDAAVRPTLPSSVGLTACTPWLISSLYRQVHRARQNALR